MKFNQEIHKKLDRIFQNYRLSIIKEDENYIELKSDSLIITLVYNPFEKLCSLTFLTLTDRPISIEIDNESLRNFFKASSRLNYSDVSMFTSQVANFFENEGKSFIKGHPKKISELENYSIERDKSYTKKFE